MKKAKRDRSVRVMSAAEESISSEMPADAMEAPSAADFDAFFPWMCARLHEQDEATAEPAAAPPVLVRRIIRQEKVADKSKSTKAKKTLARLTGSTDAVLISPVPSDGGGGGTAPLYIGAAYDALDRLVEVSIGDVAGGGGDASVPRIMLRALAVCAPHQPFLVRLTVRGILDLHALRDIAELLSLTTLTELRFDDSPLAHADWHTLLQPPCSLRYLSLCRSRVDDTACSTLASALGTRTALALLDLSSNCIGDEGSACLAVLLRDDRHLRYLNLSDNRIGDAGCLALLGTLGEFPLSCDEIVTERRRRLAAAREQLERQMSDTAAPPVFTLEFPRAKGKPGTARVAATGTSARMVQPSAVGTGSAGEGDADAEELEPYALTQTVSRSGYLHCVGNSALVYLNLAYNALGRWSVRRAIDILRQQSGGMTRAAAARPGLLRIVLEGNPLPPDGSIVGSSDVSQLEDILEKRLADAGAAVSDKKKCKK